MGYILPINHEQYTQYANRTIKKEEIPFTLMPIYKVTMDTKLKNSVDEKEPYKNTKTEDNHTLNKIDPDLVDYYVTSITGKGTLFNEVV